MIHGVVYRYISPSGKSYIGQTKDEHKRRLCFKPTKYYSGSRLDNAIKKYGIDSFTYEILYRNEYNSFEEATNDLNEKEKYYIAKYDSYRNGYNMTLGGEGVRGFRLEGEAKERMIIHLKKHYLTHPNPFQGKKHSEKTRELLSELAKQRVGDKNPNFGKPISENQRKILSECAKKRKGELNSFYNRRHSEETKKRVSEANSKPVIQLNAVTGEAIREFSSALEAGKWLGNPRLNSEIVKVCRGYVSPSGKHYITCKGYKWKYKEQ